MAGREHVSRLFAAVAAALTAVAAALVVAAPPAAAQNATRMRVQIEGMSPRVVDATTGWVTITGTLTNTGDRKVRDIGLRLQRGDVLDTEDDLREALADPERTSALGRPARTSGFQPVGADLEPGRGTSFQIEVPLGRDGLAVDRPGVYPLAINVNGVPDYGRTERVGALTTLLPVLSVPGGEGVRPPAEPARLAVLWPLLDQPHRVRAPLDGGAPLLAEDDLAGSLAEGGRLHSLLVAAREATAADPALLRSMCFVVDPDLLTTAQAMTEGYRVRTAEGPVEGRGAAAARAWLTGLRELTRGQCVIAVPFADADLAALSRADSLDLQVQAMTATEAVETALGVEPLPGVVWPAGGTLDPRTLADLTATRPTTVVADATRLQRTQGQAPYKLAENLRAIPYDELVASSLAPADGEATSSVQNGLASLVFRSGLRAEPGAPLVVAPPRRWAASADELAVFLGTVRALQAQGFAQPLPLGTLVSGQAPGAAAGLEYTAGDSAEEVPAPVTAEIARLNGVQRELVRDVLSKDGTTSIDPTELLAPLREGLIRASSTVWRDRPDGAGRLVREVSDQLDGLLSQVYVTDPGRPLSLASADSPLPIYITNRLPVTVLARINVSDTPGLRPEDAVLVRIPAKALLPQYLTTEVTRAGKFTVDIWLTTESGTALGGTSRVELNSTSYGNITLAVTGAAAGALVLLVGLRLFRRLRAARSAAPEGAGEL